MRGGLVAHLRHSLHWVLIYSNSPAAAGLFAGNHKNIKTGDRFDTLVSLPKSSLRRRAHT